MTPRRPCPRCARLVALLERLLEQHAGDALSNDGWATVREARRLIEEVRREGKTR